MALNYARVGYFCSTDNQNSTNMNKKYYYLVLTAASVALTSCGSSSSSTADSEAPASEIAAVEEVAPEVPETPAVCVWDKVSVRATPEKKGKWVAALSLGESVTYLHDKKTDPEDGDNTYLKVRLTGGEEGWARQDFVVTDAKAGVFVRETSLYQRPDLLTKTDKVCNPMDIMAITEGQDDWLKVRGKRVQGKWLEEGWVKASNLSERTIDIAVAKFGQAALAQEDKEKKVAALQEIIENNDLKQAVFFPILKSQLDELQGYEPLTELVEEDSKTEVGETY